MRTLLYARVSTEDQADKYGIPLQLRACREYAARHGFEVVRELVDEGITGTTLDRPALTQLRAIVASGQADVVLCYDVDRLSRELAHLLILKPEIEKHARVEFVAASFENSPSGRMFFGMRGVVAQYERELMRERTTRGKRERAQSGLVVGGRTAYGYRYDEGRLNPDESRAEVIRQIFNEYDGGKSMRAIAVDLRQAGAPTWSGRQWGHSSVRRILTNETYAGVAHYGAHRRDGKLLRLRDPQERISLPVPALVSREVWERVQSRIAVNPSVGRPSEAYLLRGLLYCGCGRRMSGDRRRDYRAYRCNGRDSLRFRGGPCRVAMNAAKVDEVVWSVVAATFTDAGFLRAVLAEHERDLRESEPLERIRTIEAQIRRWHGREQAALSAMLDPDLVEARPTLKARYREAAAERSRLEKELVAIERVESRSRDAGNWLEESVSLLRAYVPTLVKPGQRQEFLRGVISRGEWDGAAVQLQCFIGAGELVTTCSRTDQFPYLTFALTANVA